MSNTHKANDCTTETQPARAPMLRPELDMDEILSAAPHREPRAADKAPYPPILNGQGGLWWA